MSIVFVGGSTKSLTGGPRLEDDISYYTFYTPDHTSIVFLSPCAPPVSSLLSSLHMF
jgi:hypothetical protein